MLKHLYILDYSNFMPTVSTSPGTPDPDEPHLQDGIKIKKKISQKNDPHPVPPFSEVQNDRMLNLLLSVLPLESATLWWVDETLWLKAFPKRAYDAHSTRTEHPGLIPSPFPGPRSLLEPIPMVHGSSGRRPGCLKVSGLTSGQPFKITYFRLRRPVTLPLLDFSKKNPDPPHHMLIRLNLHKPRLTENEREELANHRQGIQG